MSAAERSGRWSDHVEQPTRRSAQTSGFGADKANDYSRLLKPSGSRVSARRLAELEEALSPRDRSVLRALATVRMLSGAQAERLLFTDIAPTARGRVRRRVLGRLARVGLVATLDRRVGGVRAGSAGMVYTLSAAGQRLLDLQRDQMERPRRRSPHTPGALFLAHELAVADVYVGLVEAAQRDPRIVLARFAMEADARFDVRSMIGSVTLRPDALVVLEHTHVEDVWWLEVDRSTESLPRLTSKLRAYLTFAGLGVAGPRGVVPRVLVSVLDDRRARALRAIVGRFPAPADELFAVVQEADAAAFMAGELLGGEVEKPP